MSEFVVSARKYRPVRFDEVVGQQHVSETLKNALRQNRLAHAFLFCGPRGVGKTTNARILAKVLNCLNVGDDYEPCNVCDNCVAFNQNASFNIFELDGASNNKVDHMHQLMEQVRVPPQSGRKKVYIIDEVHMLSASAFNAFLKTLEEPPDYAVFILATTEKHKILPTILSRCQVYDFHRIKPSDMVAHLEGICKEEGLTAEQEALHLVAEKADGALRDALSIFDRLVSSAPGDHLSYQHAAEQLNVLDHGTFFEVVDSLLREDVASLYLQFDTVLANGFEPEPFLGGLARHLRQLFVCKSPQTIKLIDVSDSLRARYAEQAGKSPMSFLINALNLAAECDFRLRQAANKRLHVELYLVKMAYAQRTVAREMVAVPGGAVGAMPTPVAEKKNSGGSVWAGAAASATVGTAVAPPVPRGPSEPPERSPLTVPAVQEGLSAANGTTVHAAGPAPVTAAPVAAKSAPAAAFAPTPSAAPAPAAASAPTPAAAPAPAVAPAPVAAATSPVASTIPQPKATPKPAVAAALPSISFDEDEDEDEPVVLVDPSALTLEQLKAEWHRSGEDQPQRIRSVMKRAKLSYEAPRLTVRVGSVLAQNTLRTEAVNIREIKQTLHCPSLIISVDFDESLAPKEAPKKKVFGPAEQYQQLLNVNPAVDLLRKRFELDLDE